MTDLQKQWLRRSAKKSLAVVMLAALLVAAMQYAEFSLQKLEESGPRFWEFLTRMTPPDWSATELIVRATFETLVMAFVGTSLGVLVSGPLGFVAASNVTPNWIAQPTKWVLGILRSIPVVVVAVSFVAAVGLGPFAGILAIAFHTVGMLSKFYAEEFETADEGIVNAVRGTGANWIQTMRFGVLPQSIPQIISFTVYRLEMNFRDATVLGFVGAGGIGTYILMYVQSFNYPKVTVLLLVIIAVVTVLDQVTFWVRRWVR